MIPIIEKAGGAVLVRAPVNRILLNDAKEAIGNIKTSSHFTHYVLELIQFKARIDDWAVLLALMQV